MIEETKDYRTRDEKLDDFQKAVIEAHVNLSDAIITLQKRITMLENQLESMHDYVYHRNEL